MRKLIFTLAIIAIGFLNKGFTQCLVTNPAVELQTATEVPEGCEIVFNFSWEQEVNAGNKYAYVHLWRTDQYPDLNGTGMAYTHPSDFPTVADLSNSLGTIVIDGNGMATPVIGTEYHPIPSPAIVVLSTGLTITKESISALRERVTIKNIRLILPNCSGAGITGDIWASQAENGKNVHCVSSGVTFIVGNPRVSGFMFCPLPRQYTIQITNVGPASIDVSYNIFIDEGDAVYEPTVHDLKITPDPIGPITLAPGGIYQSGIQSYLPYSNIKPYSDNGLWVEVSTAGSTHKTIYFIANTCIPLPVGFASFSAQRDEADVKVVWETLTETDCYGFEVQRRTGRGDFVTIAFVASLSASGNSESLLRYQYTDHNSTKAVSEYRIRQKDFNGNTSLTEVRFVRGMGQESGILIYPNPSVNGQVNVLFGEMTGLKDIALYDHGGRLIRQWRAHSGNYLQMINLRPGNYIVSIVFADSNASISKKFQVSY